jgi:hypothetical protein
MGRVSAEKEGGERGGRVRLVCSDRLEDDSEERAESGHGDVLLVGGLGIQIEEKANEVIRVTETERSEDAVSDEGRRRRERRRSQPRDMSCIRLKIWLAVAIVSEHVAGEDAVADAAMVTKYFRQ